MGTTFSFFVGSCSACYISEESRIYLQAIEELEDGEVFKKKKKVLGLIQGSESIHLWVETIQHANNKR